MKFSPFIIHAILLLALTTGTQALTIQVDYRYDTNNFFDTQQKRDAMQAVADRWGAIINQNLGVANLSGADRIGFSHPGTGTSFQVSAAASQDSDPLAGSSVANEYRGSWSIPADTYIIYAGGRSISSAGIGGTGTGLNYSSVFDNPNSALNRGFNVGFGTLPVWGGAITFDTNRTWHFDLTTTSTSGALDFYSIALHEIGHVLGLAGDWDDWTDNVSGSVFNGTNALAAYNADNGTTLTSLNLVSTGNLHWQDNSYDSKIFVGGGPNTVGTVSTGNLQDLLMEPIAHFSGTIRRFEITNADVGSLEDVGWSVIDNIALSPIQSWRDIHFGITTDSGDAANLNDFDGDGYVNLVEYTLGSDPRVASVDLHETFVAANARLTLRFPRNASATGVSITVQGSDGLNGWTDLARSTGGASFTALVVGVMVTESGSAPVYSVDVVDANPVSPAHPRRFLRLAVEEL